MYDYLIVGAGMFGATFARLAKDKGLQCLVIDKREHIGGNCYTTIQNSIDVHVYGPHIFHCNSDEIWKFVNRFAIFNSFINSPVSISDGRAFSLPFNMYTFNQLWGVITPEQAHEKIESQKLRLTRPAENLEEQALSIVGTDIYELLIRGYTTKQWQRHPKNLSPEIIKRIPVRFTWNNNYFNDRYQGVPQNGYTGLFNKLLEGVDLQLNTDFLADRHNLTRLAKKVVYTGSIDEYFNLQYGRLDYRSLRFETEVIEQEDFQGNAVINYADEKIPWTRIVEHKHFNVRRSPVTVITKEYPEIWDESKIRCYPINDEKNRSIFQKYQLLAEKENNVIFGGRLAEYQYFDMHQVIGSAMTKFSKIEG